MNLQAAITKTTLALGLALLSCCGGRGQEDSAGEGSETLPAGGSSSRPSSAEAPVSESARRQYDFAAIDRLLERAVPRIGSCALLLIHDGRVVYKKAFGKYTEGQIVPIASASKWLSAAVILALADEGRLSLDDPVSKHLPNFTGEKAGITVRQLFSHTSGLPPDVPCRNDKSTTLEDCADRIAGLALRADPGTEFYYGGTSMHLGGRIAEVAGAKPWNDLFVEKIGAPVGMKATDFYAYGRTRNPRPEGDARSSLDDYGRFLLMILNRGTFEGRRVLSEKAVAEMQKDQTAGAHISYTIYKNHGGLNPDLPGARYGLGAWREVVDERTGELLEMSSQGALGFSPWIDLERNLAGVLLAQSSMSRVMPVYLELKKEVRRAVPPSQ